MAVKKKKPSAQDAGVVDRAQPKGMGGAPQYDTRPWEAILAALQAAGTPPSAEDLGIKPFLTPQETVQFSTELGSLDDQEAGARRELGDLRTDTDYQKGELEDVFRHRADDTNWSAAARGVFQSSIRDGALDDLRRTRDVAKGLLDSKLETARLDIEGPNGRLARIGQRRQELTGASTSAASENAKTAVTEANKGFQPRKPVVPTTPAFHAGPAAQALPAPAAAAAAREPHVVSGAAQPVTPEHAVVLKPKRPRAF